MLNNIANTIKKNYKNIKIIKLAILIIIVILALVLFYYCIKHNIYLNNQVSKFDNINTNNANEIPKLIWAFWDNDDIPITVQKCIDTWKKYNPDYKITIVSKKNIKEYIDDVDIFGLKYANTPQRTSDFIRVYLLKRYGGFWIDASIMLTSNLEWIRDIQKKDNYEVVGYYIERFTTNQDYPVIENWFFACVPNSNFLNKWYEIFMKINEYDNIDDFVNFITKESNVDIQKIDSPGYLTMHISAQYVMQKLMTIEDIKKQLYLMKAEDGPFKYLHSNNWEQHKAIKAICENSEFKTPIIKFRGPERNIIEQNKDLDCIFNI
jgi:mannosyltransferase OCH1-like enzyme